MNYQRACKAPLIRAANDNALGGREIWHDMNPSIPITQPEIEIFSLIMDGTIEVANDNNPPPPPIEEIAA